MKKRCLIFAMVAAFVMLPLMAQAATEFTLGGYLKLATGWTSDTQTSLNFSNYVTRNNGLNGGLNNAAINVATAVNAAASFNNVVANRNHGKLMMSATGSRFNFTIKGPELWGAKITGLFEVDFDGQTTATAGNNRTTVDSGPNTSQGVLRLRHAMFRLNWPETELMFGQYWGALSEWGPDVIDGGAMCLYGFQSLREPQIRLTQKFAGDWQVAAALSAANNGRWGINLDGNDTTEGESSETPKVTGRVRYEKDLWGKAPYLGALKGFVAELGGSWYRTRHTARNLIGASTWGFNNYQANGNVGTGGAPFGVANGQLMGANANGIVGTWQQANAQYRNNWMIQGTFFIPVIPTYSKNLAGTMSVLVQPFLGQGLSGWRMDLPNADRYWSFRNSTGGGAGIRYNYNIEMVQRWGVGTQIQYYFNNEWFINANYGINQAIGNANSKSRSPAAAVNAANPLGYKYATLQDQVALAQMVNLNLWYRPIQALKLGLQYTFQNCGYYQATSATATGFGATAIAADNFVGNKSKEGYTHSLMFGGFFFF
jgi:hypothetical protein